MSAPDLGKWLTPTGVIVGGVVLAAVALWWNRKAIADAAGAVGQAINPTSDQNLAYRGVNAVGAAVSGNKDFSLGSWLYDVFNPNEGERLGLTGPTPSRPRPTTGDFARLDRQLDAAYGASSYGQEPAYDLMTGLPIGTGY